ncbi:MAG: hypothetical protein R3323_06930, partial [Wenzhouxiangellaceae bacterium]|nr:hypothetical protein [Wenzhouxiangellaceae bacterium]
ALVFAWAFELTPEGLKLDRDAQVPPEVKHQTTRTLDQATLVVALLAIVLLVVDRLVPEPSSVPATVVSPSESAREPDPGDDEPDPASIAVLPFDDLSPTGDQQYFSDGIAEEILNVLVRIDGLEVASRTSAFRFRDRQDVGIPGIAEALKVRHVLEGSVRKAGDTIRVTAQLIDGETDKHLWSETYDRSLTAENLFAIQDDIATAIVAALRQSIDVPVAATPQVGQRTENLDAYELFLEARSLYNKRKEMDRSDRLLARAVELDPDFAAAWAIRAAIYMLDGEYGQVDVSRADAVQRVEEFSGRALAADPDNALALAVLAFNRQIEARNGRAEHRIESIIADLQRALELDPKNGSARNWLGISYGETGQLAEVLDQFSRCADDDPYYAPCVENRYDTLATLGREEEAFAAYLEALESGAVTEQWTNFRLLVHFGLKAHFLYAANLPFYLPGWTRHDEIWAAWNDLEADHDALARDIGAFIDDRDEIDERFGGPVLLLAPLGGGFDLVPLSILIWGPEYAKYRRSEEFKARMRAMDIPRYWREHGFPPQCQATVTERGEDDFECE